ncbi:MAG: molecular chaperone HtpG [Alphaproteobacteria bacterium]|nr:molecular chaperone HtpG [Alphaproteobacteria bacterium]
MTQQQESLKFNAEVGKVLQLMIHSLYTNKDIFLRELISNASDACDKLRYEAITAPELLAGDADLKISIALDKEGRKLTIADSGIGMSREELINNLGTIAKSGTQEFLASLAANNQQPATNNQIGQFGVGFYSAFMVADDVTVTSRRAGSSEAWKWQSDGNGEFRVTACEGKLPRGTSITLTLKAGEDDYLDPFCLRHIVETYSNHISFPITLAYDDVADTVNTGSALWTRPKNEVTKEQYDEFYRHVSHSPDEPWLTLHNKNEGKLEYSNLLFIPSIKPFDLYHPERKKRVKLYVKRVYITEENVDIVPAYMRFLRGVIDSADLPLNISRETLQANPLLANIKEAVAKRVLSELRKKSESDSEGYQKFWDNFGPVLKEGLCESYSPREAILEVCRFASTAEASTTLDAYIARMKEGQEQIFYLSGESVAALKASPQLEGFAARGIEVLLFTDHVDDFWLNVVHEYKGKKFKSITKSDIEIDQFPVINEKEKPAEELAKDSIETLCKRMKETLGEHVREVRATHKLGSSAVCLATAEGAMDFRFERFLIEQKQLASASAKILEVNPAHPIIKSLAGDSSANADDIIWLLFDQARILEGEGVLNPADFTRRLQGFVEKSLAA